MSNTTTRLINALKTITSESQDIKFDKTVQGKIVAIVNEEQYRVSINNAIVLAYVTDGSTYKEGDSVYILIPEGDPSNIKTITGKVPLTSSAIVVTDPMEGISKVGMPFEDLYGLTGRRVSIIPDQSGVRKDVNIVNYDYPSRYEEIVETSKKYSHMMLTADFYNFFSEAASITKGSFGMHLTFSCLYENNYTTLEVELDSADMLGDIYSLAAPVTMYKFFSIPYGYVVTGLEQVSIYQGGNFNGNINEATDWIIGGNIHLSFIDGENIRNNEIKFSLTTEDNGTYFSDEVDILWLYGSTDKVVSGEIYFWFQQDDSVNSMSDSGYNQYGGIGWRLLDATTENKYAISNYDGFIQSNYKAVVVINTGQFYVSNIITLNQSGINIPQLKYHIEEDIIKFDLDFNKNEYEIYWRKENAMHNPIYDWAGEEDSYDAIESRAWYYVTVLKYGTGEIVYNAAKTIVSSAENGTIINDFSGALLHHYDANGDLSQDAQDSIYSLTAEMGDSVGGRWDLPADVVFPYQSDDSLLIIQSVSANTIYYKLAPKYDANKMNNTLAYIIGDERYSQYITVLKDGDNGTNGTRYSAKIVRTPRSSRYLYHNGYDWINNEYEVQVLVYKDGVSVEDFKVKQWLIPKTRAVINSVLKLQNDALTCKIRFETDAEAIGLPWNKATVIGEVESSNDSLIYQWTVDGQIYSNTSTCKFDIEKDFEGQLQCVILDSHGDKVGEFNQIVNAEAVDNSHTSLTNSAIGYYTKRINTDENNHILSIGVEGTRDDIVNYYQNVVEAEIEVDGYSIFAYHAVPVCYGVNQVEVEEINSNVIYKSDGMNPQFTPFAIVSNITNPEITTLGQASIVGGEYTPASKFLYDEGMPAIRVTDVDSDSFCIVPIVTILNNYGLSYLNSWDGTSIEINEDGGYILAPQIGAGVKEEDNSFSGVLMGQLEGVSSNAGLVGLYGFDHGSASYGFLQDGTAFIGKSGLGQIKFDGNESTIMSANYEVNKKGMKLDLLNGTIDASGFNIDKEGNASFNGNVVAVSGQFGPLVLEDGKIVYRSTDPIEGLSIDAEYSYNNVSNYKYNEDIQRPTSIEALIASDYYMKYTNQGDWVLAKNYGTWLRDNEINIDDEENLHIGEQEEKTNAELHDELKDENWSKSPNEPTATNNYLWQRINGSEDEIPYTYLLVRKYQTVDDVFNELTNQGRTEGFFFGKNGKLYVNAEMIKAGYIDADRIEAGSITINKLNNNVKLSHILSSTESTTYSNALTWTAEGYDAGWWKGITTLSSDNLKIGDIVRVKFTISNMNNTPVYAIGTVTQIDIPNNRIKMISHGLDSTVIDGGHIIANSITSNQIAANSIGAKHLTISDNSNLAQANELYENSLPVFTSRYNPSIQNGYLIKKEANENQQYLMVTNYMPNTFKKDDELYYEFFGKADSDGHKVQLKIWGYNGTFPNITNTSDSSSVNIELTETEQFYSGSIKLKDNINDPTKSWAKTQMYLLGFRDVEISTDQIYIKQLLIRKKGTGTLIVDGSITADNIAANAVTADKIAANAITANKIAGGVITSTHLAQNSGIATTDQIPTQTSQLINNSGYVEEENILDATQIIYYRSNDDLNPPIAPEDNEHNPEWLEEQDSTISKYGAWSKKIAEPTGNYMYLYSCVQTKMLDGTVSNSGVREDDGSGGGKAREQYIYYLSATDTSPAVPTTWCINTTDEVANWTTSPPTYMRTHPYKYVAIQTQSVAQQNYGGICCNASAALLDNTTTVIDGGHISTGTIQSNTDQNGNFWDLNNGLLKIGEESSFTWLTHDENLPVPPSTINGVGFYYNSNYNRWEFSGTATANITVNLYHLNEIMTDLPEHHCFSFETSEGLLDTNSGIQVWFNDTNITNKQYDIIDGVLDNIKLSIDSGTAISQGSYIKVNYRTGVINGNVIKANTINGQSLIAETVTADKINIKGLEVYNDNNEKTLSINQNGEFWTSGAVENAEDIWINITSYIPTVEELRYRNDDNYFMCFIVDQTNLLNHYNSSTIVRGLTRSYLNNWYTIKGTLTGSTQATIPLYTGNFSIENEPNDWYILIKEKYDDNDPGVLLASTTIEVTINDTIQQLNRTISLQRSDKYQKIRLEEGERITNIQLALLAQYSGVYYSGQLQFIIAKHQVASYNYIGNLDEDLCQYIFNTKNYPIYGVWPTLTKLQQDLYRMKDVDVNGKITYRTGENITQQDWEIYDIMIDSFEINMRANIKIDNGLLNFNLLNIHTQTDSNVISLGYLNNYIQRYQTVPQELGISFINNNSYIRDNYYKFEISTEKQLRLYGKNWGSFSSDNDISIIAPRVGLSGDMINFGSNNLRINNKPLKDFVTNTDQTTYWNYRIWGNGRQECWRREQFSNIAITDQATGSALYTSNEITINFPNAITFSQPPIVTITVDSNSGAWAVITKTTSTSSFSFKFIRHISAPASSNTKYYINIHAFSDESTHSWN